MDGNGIEATEHRLKALRGIASGALPGKSLVIYAPELEMATAVFPCEDGHAQVLFPTVFRHDLLRFAHLATGLVPHIATPLKSR